MRGIWRTIVAVAIALGALVVGAWTVLLGWDVHKHLNAAGTLSGPYEPWQVLVLGVLILAAVLAAARSGYWPSILVVPVVLTACFSYAGATDPQGDGLWPVGALMLLALSGGATAAVAGWGARLRRKAPAYGAAQPPQRGQ